MTESFSTHLLNRFPMSIDLGLRPAYRDLLAKLGHPERHLSPIFHVAGTNGKGSTCAFLRAFLEAAGHSVHVYTSPHLVNYHERIRIQGNLIEEEAFVALLEECLALAEPGGVTIFEALTAVALTAFARHKADFTILEVGLGGRLDATNVIEHPLATLITRLSYDHRQHLGSTLREIASEKAGIMKAGRPCFVAPQPDPDALEALRVKAAPLAVPLSLGGRDWRVTRAQGGGFHYHDGVRDMDLPPPSLRGEHQLWNAGLAIAALGMVGSVTPKHIAAGLQKTAWPARLQLLTTGLWRSLLGPEDELWLDGGHNDSAGEVLSLQTQAWALEGENPPRPLHVICAMLTTKNSGDFLKPLKPYIESFHSLAIPGEPLSQTPEKLADVARAAHIRHVAEATSLEEALNDIRSHAQGRLRVLICGSLYLAGYVLRENEPYGSASTNEKL